MLLPLLCCALPAMATQEYDPEHPENLRANQITGQSAVVIEAETGEAVFEKNADDLRYPASTTKILTVLLGITMGNPDDLVTVSESAVQVPEGSSLIGLVAGEQLRLDDLLRATMVFSGNEGANVIAEHISGSQEAFVALMNETAQRIGTTQTHFANAHGYHDENHYTTARDMALIAQTAMQNQTFREIAATTSYTLERNEWRGALRGTADSAFLLTSTTREQDKYYYPFATGIKTGFTDPAGYCFVGAAEKDGIQLISVMLKGSAIGRWTDTKRLMEYGFKQYITTSIEELFRNNPKVIEISSYAVEDEDMGRLELALRKVEPQADDRLIGFAGQTDEWTRIYNTRTSIAFDRTLEAPVEAGEVMGTMTYTPEGGDGQPVEYQLIAKRSIQRRPAIAPTLDEIRIYTENDPNPFPRFSIEFLALVLLPIVAVVGLSQLFYKLFTRKKKPKIKRRTTYKTRYYR